MEGSIAVGVRRVQPDDFVCVRFDGVKSRDADKLDELGKKFFTREDGSYNRRDLFYFFLFQLRGFDDLFSGMERRIQAEMRAEFQKMLDGDKHGTTKE